MNEISKESKLVLNAIDLKKEFSDAGKSLQILRCINLEIESGDKIAIVGSSGSGKTTLLQLLGGLDIASSGKILIGGKDLSLLKGNEISNFRNRSIGFIYQFHHLLPEFSAIENVAMPLLIRGDRYKLALDEARNILGKINLLERLYHKPHELSGGERQRIAVARALITRPLLVLADEPTGNLDSKTSSVVFDLMLELNSDMDTALVVVTHDNNIANKMEKVFELKNGILQKITSNN